MHWFANDLGASGRPGPLCVQMIRAIAADDKATNLLLRFCSTTRSTRRSLSHSRRLAIAAAWRRATELARSLSCSRRLRWEFATGSPGSGPPDYAAIVPAT